MRKQECAIIIGERVPYTTTIGAMIFNCVCKIYASISISGPTERITKQKILKYVSLAKESAMKISILIGYQLSKI
jgi:DNA-binding IclR family transcriptional regulator